MTFEVTSINKTTDSNSSRAPRGLPEFRLYQPRSGHPEWFTLAQQARQMADELRPKLELPRRGLPELKRRASSMRSLAENWRINRRLFKAGREDLRPFMLLWTALRTCNFTCTYCDDHMGQKYPELPNEGVLNTKDAIKLLKIMRTRASALYFAGGEPTVRKDLPLLTRVARDLNYYPIIVNTNGSLLHRLLQQDEWRTWLADMDTIIVSLDSLDLQSLRKMWVYKKPQDVVRNLLLLHELSSEMRFKLMVNTVIQPDTIEDASDVMDLANDLGIWFTQVPMNNGAHIDGAMRAKDSYFALAEKILARKKAGYRIVGSSRLNRRLLYSEKLTCRNALKPHVDFDGRLLWPCKATTNVPPEYINVLDFEHVDDLYDYACTRISPHGFHGPASNQCGGDCNWAQNYATDSYANGLANPASFLQEIREFAFQR